MRFHRFGILLGQLGLLLGAGFGAALAAGAVASADAIDDAWPYGGTGSVYAPLSLPGFLEAGSETNGGQDQFGPITDTYGDYAATHTAGGTDEWYAAHANTFVIPSFYTDDRTEVTGLLDDSATFPSTGTVFDKADLFPIGSPIGIFNLFENSYLNDPELGFADQFTVNFLLSGGSNTILSDAAGVEDLVSIDGQQFTLFDLPYSANSGTDISDGFAQLLAELAGAGG